MITLTREQAEFVADVMHGNRVRLLNSPDMNRSLVLLAKEYGDVAASIERQLARDSKPTKLVIKNWQDKMDVWLAARGKEKLT